MKTQVYNTHFEKIVLNSINLEPYDIVTTNLYDTFREVYNIFLKEYVHHNNRQTNEVVLFSEWLQGLPTVLSVPFENYKILQSALLYGYNIVSSETVNEFLPSKKIKPILNTYTQTESEFLENYFLNVSKAFFTLRNNY